MPKEDTQFKPGQSGNPAGRPKGSLSLVTKLKQKLEAALEDGTLADQILDAYIRDALDKRDGVAIRDMMDRTDGKPTNRHEIESDVVIRFDPEDEEL